MKLRALNQIETILNRLESLTLELKEKQKTDFKHVFYDHVEFCDIMNISSSTAQIWRNEGFIRYTKIKGKFYYKRSDIEDMLNEYSIKNS